jgi:hypothetical protein
VYDEDIKKQIVYPSQVGELSDKKKSAVLMDNDFGKLKSFLIN